LFCGPSRPPQLWLQRRVSLACHVPKVESSSELRTNNAFAGGSLRHQGRSAGGFRRASVNEARRYDSVVQKVPCYPTMIETRPATTCCQHVSCEGEDLNGGISHRAYDTSAWVIRTPHCEQTPRLQYLQRCLTYDRLRPYFSRDRLHRPMIADQEGIWLPVHSRWQLLRSTMAR
jgi:hypothetical protein